MEQSISSIIEQICDTKGIDQASVIKAIETALAAAYRKEYGNKNQNICAEFNTITGANRIFDVKTIVEDKLFEEFIALKDTFTPETAHYQTHDQDNAEIKRFNPRTDMALTEAKKINPDINIGETLKTELPVPTEYGRIAAQAAKQVIIQQLREVERETIYNDFKDKQGHIISGQIQREDTNGCLVIAEKTPCLLPIAEQVVNEKYRPDKKYKFYVLSVDKTVKGLSIILSRTHPELLRQLFSDEIPEIKNGTVSIVAIAREAGSRSKVAVSAKDIDPVGACIGQGGSRIRAIITEIGEEKIDIIEYNDDPERYITNVLYPAKISKIDINNDYKKATVWTEEDQISLAIGKTGQNVRLAVKLTGWNIDIQSLGKTKTEDSAETTEDTQPAVN